MNAESAALMKEMEIDVLARTLWGEARGEGSGGMQAVAGVVLNRLAVSRRKGKLWWGNDVIGICQKPYQFSCWNKNDPNFGKASGVDARNIHFAVALRIARGAVEGRLGDMTGG